MDVLDVVVARGMLQRLENKGQRQWILDQLWQIKCRVKYVLNGERTGSRCGVLGYQL